MKSLGSAGLALSVVFAFLLFGLFIELCYLVWWKKSSNAAAARTKHLLYVKPQSRCPCPSMGPNDTTDPWELNGVLWESENVTTTPEIEAVCEPRLLFTIVEETNEDMESEDGRGRKEGVRLSELFMRVDTPPPLSSNRSYATEVAEDMEFNKMMATPPPTFRFMQIAEEKLRRRMEITV